MVGHQIALLLCAFTLSAQTRQVAITFDDLPRGGDSPDRPTLVAVEAMTAKLLGQVKGVPITGFVNAGQERNLGANGVQEVLRLWVKHGADLGNHTYSHPDLNAVPLEQYTGDITRGEPAITAAQGRRPIFFRHPFLRTGKEAATRDGLDKFLRERGYTVAPVTIDNSDYLFAALYAHALKKNEPAVAKRARDAYIPYMESQFEYCEWAAKQIAGRDVAQILLLHANQLNADTMDEMLVMIRRRGYQVVPLAEALKDAAYSLPEHYVGPGGFSWIHRWARTKGLKFDKWEPDPAPWVEKEFQRLSARSTTAP
jgi:peptidoglycan/xylan/chitin deacetylase (PgdA/CDA1 family)